MAFTAKDVQALREKTGVGMMDCKKALTETDGDMEKAIEFLRKKGLAAAEKKASRIAAEGMVYPYYDADKNVGVVVEVLVLRECLVIVKLRNNACLLVLVEESLLDKHCIVITVKQVHTAWCPLVLKLV